MAKNITICYIDEKYKKLISDIERRNKIITGTIDNKFHSYLLEQYTKSDGTIPNDKLLKIINAAKFNPFLRNAIREHYHYQMSEFLLDKLIEITPATEIKFMLCRNDLTSQQINDIILKYETYMASSLEDYINEFPDKISNTVLNHIFTKRTRDFKRWNYSPYKITNNKKEIDMALKSAKASVDNEKLNLALINNPNINDKEREEIFFLGCDYKKVENPTPNMAKEIYMSAVQTIFDCDYTEEHFKEIEQAKEQIQKHMSILPTECLYDLIRRCEYDISDKNEYNAKAYNLIMELVNTTNDGKILREILNGNIYFFDAKLMINNKEKIDEKTYVELTKNLLSIPEKMSYFLRTAFTCSITNEKILNEFFKTPLPDKNMLMALLVSPYSSLKLCDKVETASAIYGEKFYNKIRTLQLLREKLNENGEYEMPYIYSIMAKITLNLLEDDANPASRTILAIATTEYGGLYNQKTVDFIKNTLNKITHTEGANNAVKKEINAFLKQFEKELETDRPFLANDTHSAKFPIFTIENGNKIKLSNQAVEQSNGDIYNEMIKNLNNLSKPTLEKMKFIITRDIFEKFNNKITDVQYRIYKIADFYNAIDERIKNIEKENYGKDNIEEEREI